MRYDNKWFSPGQVGTYWFIFWIWRQPVPEIVGWCPTKKKKNLPIALISFSALFCTQSTTTMTQRDFSNIFTLTIPKPSLKYFS